MALLRSEDAARRAPAAQRRMEDAEGSGDTDWIEVATDVQRSIARRSLPPGSDEAAVDARVSLMRGAAQRHPEVAHWVRFNRARRGDLRAGDEAPDVRLYRLDGTPSTLFADRLDRARPKPFVVVSGSVS